MASTRAHPVRNERLAVDYSRFSTEHQSSVDEQQAINDELAVDEDIVIVKRFADEEMSRSIAERPDLRGMFNYLEEHTEVGFIIVNELERLTAGIGQRDEIVRLCKRLRITILTEDMGAIDPFDDEKMHQADERAVKAAGEVLKIRRRTKRNLRQKVIAGTVAMRPAYGTRMRPPAGAEALPAGTRLIDARGRVITTGVLEEHPEEIEWLRQIFAWADAGLSNDKICRRLIEAGVPTKSGNSQWRGNTIAGILSNPLYKGEIVWGKQAVIRDADGKKSLEERELDDPGRVTKVSPLGALVDADLWARVNAKARRALPRRQYGKQLLDDLVYCGRCGHKMYGRNDASGSQYAHRNIVIWRYYCYSTRPGYEPLDGYGPLCAKPVHSLQERKILSALATLLSQPEGRIATVRATRDDASTARQQQALRDHTEALRTEQKRAKDLLIRGLLDEGDFVAANAAREDQIAVLQERLARLEAAEVVTEPLPAREVHEVEDGLGRLVELLSDSRLSVASRREALDNFGVRRIYVDNPLVTVDVLR